MPTLSDESSRLPGQNAQRCRGFSLAAATEGERNSRVQTRCNNARLCTRGWNEFEKRVRVRGRVGADLRVRPGCAFPQEGAHIGAPLRVSSYGLFVLMPTTMAVPQLLRRDNRG